MLCVVRTKFKIIRVYKYKRLWSITRTYSLLKCMVSHLGIDMDDNYCNSTTLSYLLRIPSLIIFGLHLCVKYTKFMLLPDHISQPIVCQFNVYMFVLSIE